MVAGGGGHRRRLHGAAHRPPPHTTHLGSNRMSYDVSGHKWNKVDGAYDDGDDNAVGADSA